MPIQESEVEKWKEFNKLIVDILDDSKYKFTNTTLNSKLDPGDWSTLPIKKYFVCKGKECYKIEIRPCYWKDTEFKDIAEIYEELIEPRRIY